MPRRRQRIRLGNRARPGIHNARNTCQCVENDIIRAVKFKNDQLNLFDTFNPIRYARHIIQWTFNGIDSKKSKHEICHRSIRIEDFFSGSIQLDTFFAESHGSLGLEFNIQCWSNLCAASTFTSPNWSPMDLVLYY